MGLARDVLSRDALPAADPLPRAGRVGRPRHMATRLSV